MRFGRRIFQFNFLQIMGKRFFTDELKRLVPENIYDFYICRLMEVSSDKSLQPEYDITN
jgi:hypothetical protein